MSNVEKSTSTEVAIPDEFRGLGTEDVDQSDVKTPRLKINHQVGTFQLYDTVYETLDCVVLGMFKQRVLWKPGNPEPGLKPICRSFDFKTGHPDPKQWSAKFAGEVPADVSGFGTVVEGGDGLPCRDCGLKEFGTHPISETAPWCSEQHVYALIVTNDDIAQPALLTLAKTALAPSRNFLQPFAMSKTPMFTQTTNISLNLDRSGGNIFSVPLFQKTGSTDQQYWKQWADQFRTIKAFVTTPRSFEAEETEQAVAAPTRAPKEPSTEVDDSLWDEDE